MENVLPMIMDVMVMALLAATIYYAMHLSRQLKLFRSSRKGIEALMKDLSGQIDRAENAVQGLRAGAEKTGRDLQDKINEAKSMKDEIDFLTETCESLAKRLENASDRSSSSSRNRGDNALAKRGKDDKPVRTRTRSAPQPFSFAIRDPEFEQGDDSEPVDKNGLLPGDYEEDQDEIAGLSRAEQELYAALKKRKESAGGY